MTCRPRVRHHADGHADAYCTRHAIATSGHPDAAAALAALEDRHRTPTPLILRPPAPEPRPRPIPPAVQHRRPETHEDPEAGGIIGIAVIVIVLILVAVLLIEPGVLQGFYDWRDGR